jgi:hypothetical protein
MEPEEEEATVPSALAAVDKMIERVQESLCEETVKPTFSDLMRLLELRRELAQAQPRPITVRWVDECPKTETGGE